MTGATKGKGKKPRTVRNAEEEAQLELLNEVKDMLFVGRMLGLRDIFQHTSSFSLFAQTVNVLPWELQERGVGLVNTLRSIYMAAEGTKDKAGELPAAYFPLLHKDGTWQEVAKGRYQGIELVLPWVDDEDDENLETLKPEEVVKQLIKEAADFCKVSTQIFIYCHVPVLAPACGCSRLRLQPHHRAFMDSTCNFILHTMPRAHV